MFINLKSLHQKTSKYAIFSKIKLVPTIPNKKKSKNKKNKKKSTVDGSSRTSTEFPPRGTTMDPSSLSSQIYSSGKWAHVGHQVQNRNRDRQPQMTDPPEYIFKIFTLIGLSPVLRYSGTNIHDCQNSQSNPNSIRPISQSSGCGYPFVIIN